MALRKLAVRGINVATRNVFKCQHRCFSVTVDEDSWAAEFVRKNGGTVVKPTNPRAEVEFNEFLLNNPNEKVKNLIEEICKLTVAESAQLNILLSETLGVSMALAGGGGGGDAGTAPAAEAAPAAPVKKEIFDIKIGAVDAKAKLKIIKEIRTITGLGLKEAKELVEKAPVVVKTGLKTEEAEEIKKTLIEAGAEVELL